jgi:hypothetical protein
VDQSNQVIVKLRADNLMWRQVGNELMVLDTNSSEYLAVNKTGVALWPLLLAGATRAVLAEALVEHFQIDLATAASDAERFVSSLEDLGLLEPPPAG